MNNHRRRLAKARRARVRRCQQFGWKKLSRGRYNVFFTPRYYEASWPEYREEIAVS